MLCPQGPLSLSCISTPLIDVFGGGGAGAYTGGGSFAEPQYDTAGDAMARAGQNLYDAVPAEDPTGYTTGANLDPLYDEAQGDTGYLGVEPASAYPDVYNDAGQGQCGL